MFVVLKAEKREKFGSSQTRKIKREGRIPAIIYSKNGNINLSLSSLEFEHEYFKGNALTSVVELELDGKKIKVIPHKIELDPVSDRPVHVDFFNASESKTIRAKPKLVFINQEKSPGLKKGGVLHIVMRKLAVICDSEKSIPEKIEVDVGSTQVGSKIRAKNLKLPSGVSLLEKDNFLVGSVIGRGKSEEEEAAEAAAAAAAAGAVPGVPGAAGPGAAGTTPAAGAAAPAAAGATPAKGTLAAGAAKPDDKKAAEKKK
jgi:large subunit ribosomal protein L25